VKDEGLPVIRTIPDAARTFRAALSHLDRKLGDSWVASDWEDRTLRWRFYSPQGAVSPDCGWKIHVSASAFECPRMLRSLADALDLLRLPFKLPRRVKDVEFLNSGDAGTEQLGKIVTVYPPDDNQLKNAVAALDAAWPSSSGPEVRTDLQVRLGSAVSFRFGVFRAGKEVVSSTGVHELAVTLPDGSIKPDARSLIDETTVLEPAPPIPGHAPGPDRIKLGQPVKIGGSEYVALSRLGQTARATTYLAADLCTLRTVVLKAGRRGAAGDAAGVDIRALLRREHSALEALRSRQGLAPTPVHFQDGEAPALVMEDLRGDPISELPRQARLDCLPLLAEAVAALHELELVHGDIKLDNALLLDGRVGLIDFELCARVGEPMRPGGTPGHLAPEVRGKARAASPARDVFALGACVVHAALEIPPGLLPGGPRRIAGLLRNEGLADAAPHVAQWLATDPARRPAAREVAAVLRAHVGSWTRQAPAHGAKSSPAEMRWFRRASLDAALASNDFLQLRDCGACWRNEHFMREFRCEAINLGAAGIVLGLLTVDHALGVTEFRATADRGAQWLASRSPAGKAAGPFTGNAGVALALAVAGVKLDRPAYLAAARDRFDAAAADQRELDLFSGSAGVVWSACLLREILGEDWPLEAAEAQVKRLVGCASSASGVPVWADEAAGKFFGCAHGSAGVALALASWGRAAGDEHLTNLARETFQAIVRHGRTADGRALRVEAAKAEHHAVGNWCHGVAGYLWSIWNGLGDDPSLRA
jgi:serine/threonine protein kinase